HQPLPPADCRLVQHPRALLSAPPSQHSIEHRPRRIQLRDALSEHEMRCPGDLRTPTHPLARGPNSLQQCCICSGWQTETHPNAAVLCASPTDITDAVNVQNYGRSHHSTELNDASNAIPLGSSG